MAHAKTLQEYGAAEFRDDTVGQTHQLKGLQLGVPFISNLASKRQITVLPVLAQDGALAGLVHLHDLLGKGRVRFAPQANKE